MLNGIIRIGTEINTKKFDQQIAQLERELKQKKKQLSVLLQVQEKQPKSNLTKGIEDLRASIERTENSIISLNEKSKKLGEDKNINLKEGFDSAFKSAKRLVMGIIGIRAAYSLIRKASSAYLADNEETTSKISSLWTGLGTIMGPVIEYIVNLLKKAVTAVLQFMSVLTGTNYIAKANESILKKQAKATNDLTKATNKYNASFDEMNVLNDSPTNDYGADNVMASLFDINDLSENTRRAIEKIGEALKPIYNILKDIIKWSLEHPEVILGILGGVALLSMLNKIIGYAGVGTAAGAGLAGILGVLLAIASIGIITIKIKTIFDEAGKLNEAQEDARKINDSVIESSYELQRSYRKTAKEAKYTEKQINNLVKGNKNLVESGLSVVKAHGDEYSSMNDLDKAVNSLTGHTQALSRMSYQYIGAAFDEIYTLSQLYKQGKLNDEQTKDYNETLKKFMSVVGEGGTSVSELTKQFGLNATQAKQVQAQYNIVATELYRMYKNGDDASNVLNNMPKNVKTVIENNFDKNLDLLDKVKQQIETLPFYKQINVETKVTADTSSAKSTLEKLFSGMSSAMGVIDRALGTKLKYTFDNIYLANGGIVNNPGRGVSIGSNIIAGEKGAEAVLPLTDDTLQRLANMIPITVNVTNTMNGRVISRELQRVQNDSDFAYNR